MWCLMLLTFVQGPISTSPHLYIFDVVLVLTVCLDSTTGLPVKLSDVGKPVIIICVVMIESTNKTKCMWWYRSQQTVMIK